jgi:hypothetical protein
LPYPQPSEPRGSLSDPEYAFPTTIAQQAFWYLDRLTPGDSAWNIAVRFRIAGPLDVPILERSINEIVRRHEILRTTFSFTDGAPTQIVHSQGSVIVPLDDLSHLPSPAREADEERRTIAEAALPFNLKTGPLLRARVLRLRKDEHVLLVAMHHIVSDGWSIGVFSDEVGAHYSAFASGAAPLPDLSLQYADYSIWQNERSQSSGLEEHRSYWRDKLANLPLCEIPTDHQRPPVKTNDGYILSTVLPVPLTNALSELSHKQGGTFFALALAALKMLIAHHTHQDDIYVGTLVAGRDRVELEPLIGVFINTIVLRTDLSGDSPFFELLARVQRTMEEGIAHQDLHFQQIVEVLRFKRDASRPTLYSINFIYQRDFVKPIEFAGLSMTPLPSKSPGAIYDLNFFMVQRTDGWRLSCEYNCTLYDAATVNRLIGQLRNLFQQIAENPDRRLSEFAFPQDVGDPLPPFVPNSRRESSSQPKALTTRISL